MPRRKLTTRTIEKSTMAVSSCKDIFLDSLFSRAQQLLLPKSAFEKCLHNLWSEFEDFCVVYASLRLATPLRGHQLKFDKVLTSERNKTLTSVGNYKDRYTIAWTSLRIATPLRRHYLKYGKGLTSERDYDRCTMQHYSHIVFHNKSYPSENK
ncbi:2511_t:CDS:2 [Cetraspora pellucida]|uniref:2511_t:CDS:1 n=1 Tax=Cetraspora pellucida TaxID=1433469 RepID=A0A9N8VPF1_9GLOM|nr:2511_t:CDS:2 [Cetraspora pellucida]